MLIGSIFCRKWQMLVNSWVQRPFHVQKTSFLTMPHIFHVLFYVHHLIFNISSYLLSVYIWINSCLYLYVYQVFFMWQIGFSEMEAIIATILQAVLLYDLVILLLRDTSFHIEFGKLYQSVRMWWDEHFVPLACLISEFTQAHDK